MKAFRLTYYLMFIIVFLCCTSMIAESAPIDGTFMWADWVSIEEDPPGSPSEVSIYFDELQELDVNTVIISHVIKRVRNQCNPLKFKWAKDMPQKLSDILDAADSRGMKVYVGLIFTMVAAGDCNENYYSGSNKYWTNSVLNDNMPYIQDHASENHPAFAGWYIPDEPGLAGWDNYPLSPPETDDRNDYYKQLVDTIRNYSTKRILVSPYLAGAGSRHPNEIGYRAQIFQLYTGINVQIWQDSVGAYGINPGIQWPWNKPYNLEDYYKKIKEYIGFDHLWSDNELFNCCVDSEDIKGGEYKAASLFRLNQQLWTSGLHVKKRVVWLTQIHMSDHDDLSDSSANYEAKRLKAAYKALYGLGGEVLVPQSYTWLNPPSASYPDSGNEMFDMLTGDPNSYADPSWVGRVGNAKVLIDLGSPKNFNFVAFHVLNSNYEGIKFPNKLILKCSNDNLNWKVLCPDSEKDGEGECPQDYGWPLTVTRDDSEYVFSNDANLNETCRYIKAKLENNVWTFISEIEIIR